MIREKSLLIINGKGASFRGRELKQYREVNHGCK
nr:MAG TPA: RNAseH-like protein [Bacteriophage sp.]